MFLQGNICLSGSFVVGFVQAILTKPGMVLKAKTLNAYPVHAVVLNISVGSVAELANKRWTFVARFPRLAMSKLPLALIKMIILPFTISFLIPLLNRNLSFC